MTFVNLLFYPAVFCVFLVCVLIQKLCKDSQISNRSTKAVLLAFSYVCIGLFDWRFCVCITAVILITYFSAITMKASGKAKREGVITAVAVTILVAFLGLFKYLNFFMGSIMVVFGRSWTAVNIILPIGISFYIFSAIGYVLDVHWGNIEAERSILDMALYLSFFPKLICGPIASAQDFLPQLKQKRDMTLENIAAGVQIFAFGLFKKIVLADHLAVFVDEVFWSPTAFGTMTVWLAVFSYYIQLYFDFSGYSDMAIGISRVFGYDIKKNFNLPFIARNISDFWDRWHISLSGWLNEYVFNPLALRFKRKVSQLPKDKRKKYKMLPNYAALLITFLVSGLWHGAGFTFIVWGLCHGVYSVIHSGYANWMKKEHREFAENKSGVIIALDILANYIVLNIIQVLFRAESLDKAFEVYRVMFSVHAGLEQPYAWSFVSFIVLLTATLAAFARSRKRGQRVTEGYYPINDLCSIKGLTIFFLEIGLIAGLAYVGESYFIYAQF